MGAACGRSRSRALAGVPSVRAPSRGRITSGCTRRRRANVPDIQSAANRWCRLHCRAFGFPSRRGGFAHSGSDEPLRTNSGSPRPERTRGAAGEPESLYGQKNSILLYGLLPTLGFRRSVGRLPRFWSECVRLPRRFGPFAEGRSRLCRAGCVERRRGGLRRTRQFATVALNRAMGCSPDAPLADRSRRRVLEGSVGAGLLREAV